MKEKEPGIAIDITFSKEDNAIAITVGEGEEAKVILLDYDCAEELIARIEAAQKEYEQTNLLN